MRGVRGLGFPINHPQASLLVLVVPEELIDELDKEY